MIPVFCDINYFVFEDLQKVPHVGVDFVDIIPLVQR